MAQQLQNKERCPRYGKNNLVTDAACRQSGTPRTLKEVLSAINITRKDLAVCY